MIPVTRPFLPPKEEFDKILSEIWDRNWITNNGPVLQRLESAIADYLGMDCMLVVGSGTLALQLAIRALNISGRVITTPFSYVASTSSLVWENCSPKYVDIDPNSLNLDPRLIEKSITKDVSAILATHCFGNPCEIDEILDIGKRYGLRVIFDAAHCFGSTYKSKSVFEYGDISIASFHATKLFHMVEGGGLFSTSEELLDRLGYMRNFGHDGEYKFNGLGINAKNSEFHSAMGLVNISHVDRLIEERKMISQRYDQLLSDLGLGKQKLTKSSKFNYAYYPVIFKNERELVSVKKSLDENGYGSRRYFYPGLNTLSYIENVACPNSDKISTRILCLPLFNGLSEKHQFKISHLIRESLDN